MKQLSTKPVWKICSHCGTSGYRTGHKMIIPIPATDGAGVPTNLCSMHGVLLRIVVHSFHVMVCLCVPLITVQEAVPFKRRFGKVSAYIVSYKKYFKIRFGSIRSRQCLSPQAPSDRFYRKVITVILSVERCITSSRNVVYIKNVLHCGQRQR